jgi:putative hydrolase of the HAD superfamily
MQIANIIFDFGKVIVNIDWESVRREMVEKGVADIEGLHNYLRENNYYLDLETGEISPHTFREAIREFTGNHFPDYEIDAAWNSMILDIPEHRVRLLEKLKNKYRTFLLSNTNEIHFLYYDSYFARTYDYDHLADLFEEAYFSHEMRLRKPNPEIYKVVIKKHGLNPSETLFIDDMQENIESAKSAGLLGYLLKDSEDITELFDNKLKFTGILS